jgi:hypothetical protein
MPSWKPPKDIAQALDEGDGSWEDERWSPILVTAMAGTEFEGREIPVAWQIEFDPFDDDLEEASVRLAEQDLDPDGYGWGEHIHISIAKADPQLAQRLHTGDCESSTCVIWVETEDDCRKLLETTWKLIFGK